MSVHRTLCDVLETNRLGDRTISYIAGEKDERTVSCGDLYYRALGILHHLQSQGLGPGDELILFTDSNEQFVDVFWACLLGGIVPVPAAARFRDEHRLKLFRVFLKLARPYVFTSVNLHSRLALFAQTNDLMAEFSELSRRTILVDEIDDISQLGEKHRVSPEDTALVQFSSGSTSQPKGVVLTHANILTNIDASIEAAGLREDDVTLSWMPLSHDMGLIGFHLTFLVCNSHQNLMATDLFVRRPLLWLKKASEKRATILCSPNFGYQHFLKAYRSKGLSDVDLSCVRLVFNGAEPISVDLCEDFLMEMSGLGLRSSAMFPVYGLAEASLAVSFPPPESHYKWITVNRHSLGLGDRSRVLPDGHSDGVRFMRLGSSIRDCEVRISSAEGKPVEAGVVGHIQIRGANVTHGYYRAEPQIESLFTEDGWLDTGDLGLFVDDDLIVTGRTREIIFANGHNYYPQDIENVVQQLEGLEGGRVAAVCSRNLETQTDDLLVFVRYREELFISTISDIKRRVTEKIGLEVAHVLPIDRIPKTTSGKVQRYLLASGYREGSYDAAIQEIGRLQGSRQAAEENLQIELEYVLKDIFDTVIVDKEIGIEDDLFELGTSSLALAEIYQRIEDLYPGQTEITDMFDHPTIRMLACHLNGKLAGGPRASVP